MALKPSLRVSQGLVLVNMTNSEHVGYVISAKVHLYSHIFIFKCCILTSLMYGFQYFGGTNFGRTSGGPFYITSYDYDAPIDEYGG